MPTFVERLLISGRTRYQSFLQRSDSIVVCALPTFSRIGGLQNFNRRLFRNLVRQDGDDRGARVRAIVAGDDGTPAPEVPGLEILTPPSRWRFFARAWWSAVFGGDLLLLCHINLLPLAVAVRMFRPRMSILLFVHGFEVWNKNGRPRKFHERMSLRAVTRVVSVSRYTAEAMRREFDVRPEKFRILPNAVDRVDPSPGARRPGSVLTVTRLGSSERAKNVHEMIEAVATLRGSVPELRYDIIGDGALRPELEMLARRRGVDDIVRFHGWVDAAALDCAYSSASVFAMPSDKEGFGIVYLEAWQYGLPVICSVRGASSEVVADGVDGFVVDPEDVPALAERLRLLLSDSGLAQEMGERGRQKVEGKYLNSHFRARLGAILDELGREQERANSPRAALS